MKQATTIGLYIAKHVFQVHGADGAGHVLFRKRITRAKLLRFLAAQARCVVAMEACASAHYWAREIAKLGHHVRLITPASPEATRCCRKLTADLLIADKAFEPICRSSSPLAAAGKSAVTRRGSSAQRPAI